MLQNEPANIIITITNPTDVDINSIDYNENFAGFIVTNVQGCTLNGNAILWNGPLKSNYRQECTATIVSDNGGTYDFTGNLSYFNGFTSETKSTDTLRITVLPKQLLVNQLIDEYVEVEQPFYMNVSVKNINPYENMDVSIKIDLPGNFALLNKVPGFSKDVNILESDFKLEPGAIFAYSLYLKADSESKIPIKQIFNYKIKGLSDTIENDTFVKAPEPVPLINLTSEYNELMPGQEFIVTAELRNPSRIYELTGIKATLTAPDNSDVGQKLDKLAPNESYTMISSTLTAPKNPDSPANKTVQLNLSIDYKFNGIAKSTTKSLALKLKPGNAAAGSITAKENVQSAKGAKTNGTSAAEAESGNKTNSIETKIENPKPQFFNNKILLYGIAAAAVFFAVIFVISRIRKRKKPYGDLEKKALTEISEAVNK